MFDARYLMLAAIFAGSMMYATHAQRQETEEDARHTGRPGNATPFSRQLPEQRPVTELEEAMYMYADAYDGIYDLAPFEATNVVMHGRVSSSLQEELLQQSFYAAGSGRRRALLHGVHRLKIYPECPNCRPVQCNKRTKRCSGHCHKRKRLFPCSYKNIAQAEPEPILCDVMQALKDVQATAAGGLDSYATAVVIVPAPYIGCMDITNLPSGCPARGTRATLSGGKSATVVTAQCKSKTYLPGLCPSEGTLLPFGVCECVYRTPPTFGSTGPVMPRLVIAPCSTTELEAGAGVGGSDGSESEEGLLVVPGQGETNTWFAMANLAEPEQDPDSTFQVTASVRNGTAGSVDINATLGLYVPTFDTADYVAEGYTVLEDYGIATTPDGDI